MCATPFLHTNLADQLEKCSPDPRAEGPSLVTKLLLLTCPNRLPASHSQCQSTHPTTFGLECTSTRATTPLSFCFSLAQPHKWKGGNGVSNRSAKKKRKLVYSLTPHASLTANFEPRPGVLITKQYLAEKNPATAAQVRK